MTGRGGAWMGNGSGACLSRSNGVGDVIDHAVGDVVQADGRDGGCHRRPPAPAALPPPRPRPRPRGPGQLIIGVLRHFRCYIRSVLRLFGDAGAAPSPHTDPRTAGRRPHGRGRRRMHRCIP